MNLHSYNPKLSLKKGAVEGSSAGALAILLGIIMRSIRVKNPDLPWGPTEDAAIVGAGVGILAGIWRWWRNQHKHNVVHTHIP